jgi:hypothetical protein
VQAQAASAGYLQFSTCHAAGVWVYADGLYTLHAGDLIKKQKGPYMSLGTLFCDLLLCMLLLCVLRSGLPVKLAQGSCCVTTAASQAPQGSSYSSGRRRCSPRQWPRCCESSGRQQEGSVLGARVMRKTVHLQMQVPGAHVQQQQQQQGEAPPVAGKVAGV